MHQDNTTQSPDDASALAPTIAPAWSDETFINGGMEAIAAAVATDSSVPTNLPGSLSTHSPIPSDLPGSHEEASPKDAQDRDEDQPQEAASASVISPALRRHLRNLDLRLWGELAGVEDDFDDVNKAFSAIKARFASNLCPSPADKLAVMIENLQDFIAGVPTLIWPLVYDLEYRDRRVTDIEAQARLDDLLHDHVPILPREDRNRLGSVLLAIYLKLLKAAGVSYA